ncbi:oligopeptide/dipeptide ABC transporter ATP-binding protein [Ferroacidibacillus organovorans]|uniref:oligopeptide/dipeptide ABC transporter ATP-binding protein n=1 Tax=Ferroacidibacillus organovorans TaxID=1765683 RepID=UPI001F2ED8AB|nr:oligopeptide/dipeptide ABC transporter ATP-binding protein [Ferroacidibacillus organovorans]
MELALSDQLLQQPHHPYSRLLLAATPGMKYVDKLPETSNRAPDLLSSRKGCPFAGRCPSVLTICHEQEPLLQSVDATHQVACHLFH